MLRYGRQACALAAKILIYMLVCLSVSCKKKKKMYFCHNFRTLTACAKMHLYFTMCVFSCFCFVVVFFLLLSLLSVSEDIYFDTRILLSYNIMHQYLQRHSLINTSFNFLCNMLSYWLKKSICDVYAHTSQNTQASKNIDWLFIVLRPAQEYFTYMETSPLPVKGCKI
jgi:hypothetical protein